jgi:hypothetical protein
MAFELAEQGKKDEALAIIADIEIMCADKWVLIKTLETKADAYLYVQRYDSAIYYAQMLYRCDNYGPTSLLIAAQAYSLMEEKDSAVYYAELVLNNSLEIKDINNALYILTNDDEQKSKESIRQTASNRADVQKLLEIRQGKLSQAVQLLEQDLHRKPDMRWLYAVIVTVGVIGLSLFVYIRRKRKQHQLLTQQVNELEGLNEAAKQNHERMVQEHNAYTENIEEQIENQCAVLRQSSTFRKDVSWKDFDKMCSVIDNHFFLLTANLRHLQVLNEQEIRLCVLVLFDFNRNQIADLLPYAKNGVGKFKYRVAQKLGTEGKNLRKYLISMAINGLSANH